MSDVAMQQVPGVYEPSLFGTYSKKIGMWLFLLSDSLTFGALLYAYTYGRISTPNWPTPFHSESIRNATMMTAFLLTSSLTMVFAVRSAVMGNQKAQRLWLFATMACGLVRFTNLRRDQTVGLQVVARALQSWRPRQSEARRYE